MTKELKFTAVFDRELAWRRGGSYRYLVAEIEAPREERPERAARTPLNLALVIDRSGSMSGDKIEAAKTAAIGVVNGLDEGDRLSVVCFDNEVDTLVRAVRMDEQGREAARRAIGGLDSRGMTNLAAGWLEGAECVAEAMAEMEGAQNHVVLLSDGMANEGVTDPAILAEYASGLQARGILTSTVGIGDGYSPEILQVLAEHGGGRMHDAEHPHEIIEVVLAELGEVRQTWASQLRLDIESPPDARLVSFSDYPLMRQGHGSASCQLGSIGSGQVRRVVFQVRLADGDAGQAVAFRLRLGGLHGEQPFEVTASASVAFAPGRDNNAQPRDIRASLLVASTWQSRLMRRAARANVERDYRAIDALYRGEFRHFDRYCRGLPGGDELVRRIARLLKRARRPMEERSRKEVTLFAYHEQKGTIDHRSTPRGDWDRFISD